MAAISGQPAPKPGSLNKPVPGAEQAQDAAQLLEQFNAPEVAVPQGRAPAAEAAPTGGAADLLAQFAQGAAEEVAPVGGIPAEDQFAPEPSFAQANIDQFGQFTTRLQAGLAANDTEKLGFLQKKYGENNAVLKDDKLYWRKSESEKFKPLDPGTFELLNDIIPDWSREIIQEMTMLPAEIAGGATAGPAGAAGGRALSVPVANMVADKVAEVAGVPQDETRSKMTENLVGSAVEGTLPLVGKAIKPVLKLLPGTRSYQQAIQEGERELVALSKQSSEVAKSVAALNELGRAAKLDGSAIGIPGAQVNLMGHQMNPDSPILQRFAQQAAQDPRFINAQRQLAEDWGSSLENTLKEIGKRNVKGPYSPEFLAQSVTNAVDDIVKAEGKEIGKYKAKAMAKLGNSAQPLPPTVAQKTMELMQAFKFAEGKPPKDLKSLVGTMGTTSLGEVRAIVNNIEATAKGLQKGLRIDEIDMLRNNLGSTSNKLFRTEAGARLGSLSGDMRQFYRDTISAGLDDQFDKAAFTSAMDEFSQLKLNVGVLKNALDEDASSKAIVRSFFTGKDNLAKVKAIKKISPDSFENLKQEFVDQMLTEYASRESATGVKSSQFLDAVNKKYGKEFLTEVFGAGGTKNAPGLKDVQNLLNVTERIEKTFKAIKPDQMTEQQKKGMMDLLVGVAGDVKFKTLNGMGAIIKGRMPKDHPLFEIMTREGFDKYVRDYPGKIDRRSTLRKLNDFAADVKLFRMVEAAGAEATKRGTKQYLRQEAQEVGQ